MSESTKLRPAEILGVSHLVLGVRELCAAELFLACHGYSKHDEIVSGLNPPEKSPFLFGPTARTFAMKLMVSKTGSSPIELLRENTEEVHEAAECVPNFEVVLAANHGQETQEHLAPRECENTVPFAGFRVVKSGLLLTGSRLPLKEKMALLVHCQELDLALSLWRTLGYETNALGSDIAHIKIRGGMSTNHLDLYFIANRPHPSTTYLNSAGIVCLSLFCQNADRLQSALSEYGYFTGECFTLNPFGRPFRIFFARNASGELYEFLSVIREPA